jgi:hypothetical protein
MVNRVGNLSKRLVAGIAVAAAAIGWIGKRLLNWFVHHGEGVFRWMVEEGFEAVFGLAGMGILIILLLCTALFLQHRRSSHETIKNEENHGS